MSSLLPKQNASIPSQPSRDAVPRRLIVTASVVTFAIRDWSLWVLLRDGPWGPPMRLILGNESVTDAVERSIDALLLWPQEAALLQLKAGWQEQQVYVWGSEEQGAAISLIHCMLLRANRDELRPNLHRQPVPSLHVQWTPVAEIEAGRRELDPDVQPMLKTALHALRSQVQREPEIVLRYLADMDNMSAAPLEGKEEWWSQSTKNTGPLGKETPPSRALTRSGDASASLGAGNKETLPLSVVKPPATGEGVLTLA